MASYLVQILLPVADNTGKPFPDDVFEHVKDTLVDVFGGVTAYSRSPAQGVWATAREEKQHDDIVTVEVMTETLDEAWWGKFRTELETVLRQQEIVIRAFPIRRLHRQ
jgi:hypothetical protein